MLQCPAHSPTGPTLAKALLGLPGKTKGCSEEGPTASPGVRE